MTTAAAPVSSPLQHLPLAQLRESEHNPRKKFDPAALQELAASIGRSGIITPLVARPMKGKGGPAFELAAGHRRFRAAAIAKLDVVPVVVREMEDPEFIEILNVENLQRQDIHPLEEAQGFQDLLTIARLDVPKIADRVGKSEKYVYDRLKLLDLIPAAKKLFLDDRFEAGHAILIARLTKEQQARVIDLDTEALFVVEHTLFHPDREDDESDNPYDGYKARSVRELDAWIAEHVRLDLRRDTQHLIFPEIAEKVVPAKEMNLKVIPITHDTFVQPEAKVDGERTYGPRSWKRADGQLDSKTCEYSVLGAIVVGPGRGEAFQVCIKREKCRVHWKDEVIAAEKRAAGTKGDTKGAGNKEAAAERQQREQEQREAAEKKEQERRKAFEKVAPAMVDEIVARIKKAPIKPGTAAADLFFRNRDVSARALKLLGKPKTAEDMIRLVLVSQVVSATGYHYAFQHFPGVAKPWGIDVDAYIKAELERASANAAPKAEAKKAPAKKASAKAKKR